MKNVPITHSSLQHDFGCTTCSAVGFMMKGKLRLVAACPNTLASKKTCGSTLRVVLLSKPSPLRLVHHHVYSRRTAHRAHARAQSACISIPITLIHVRPSSAQQKTTPQQARSILTSTPQIAYALVGLMVKMNAIDVQVLQVRAFISPIPGHHVSPRDVSNH